MQTKAATRVQDCIPAGVQAPLDEIGPIPQLELLFDAASLAANLIDRRLEPLGLRLTQARALATILLSDEPLTPTDIASLLLQEVQSISTLLTGLERRGLIRREANPLDKRSNIPRLTASGEMAALAGLETLRDVARELQPLLEPAASQADLLDRLEQLRDNAISYMPMSVRAYRRRLDSFWQR
jgi:DNA-binding MarR family transcriptional regulator